MRQYFSSHYNFMRYHVTGGISDVVINGKSVSLNVKDNVGYIRQSADNHVQYTYDGTVDFVDGDNVDSHHVSFRQSDTDGCICTDFGSWETVNMQESSVFLFDVLSDLEKTKGKKQVIDSKKVIVYSKKILGKKAEHFSQMFTDTSNFDEFLCQLNVDEHSGYPLSFHIESKDKKVVFDFVFDRWNQDYQDDLFVLYSGYRVSDKIYDSFFTCLFDYFGYSEDFDATVSFEDGYGEDDMIGATMTVTENKKNTFLVGFRGYRSLQNVKLEENPVRLLVSGDDSSLYSYAYLSDKVSLNVYDTVLSDQNVTVDYLKAMEKKGQVRGRKIDKVRSFTWNGYQVYSYAYEYIYTQSDSRKEFSQVVYVYYVALGNTYVIINVESQVNAGDPIVLDSAIAEDVLDHYVCCPY